MKWTQVSLKIDKTGCSRAAACSVNPGLGAAGIQADSAFHPESLSGKKKQKTDPQGMMLAHTARAVALSNLWLILVKNATSCDTAAVLMNLFWQLRQCWVWMIVAVSITLFWFIFFFWMSKHIHHRTTEDIMHLWSQARATQSVSTVCGSELEWWANSYDTATIALGLFRFIDDSM